jgi:hypothetical protein
MTNEENTIKNLKKIMGSIRLDNIDDQRKYAQSLIEERKKKVNDKDLTLKERVTIFEVMVTGHAFELEILKERVETLERKLKQLLFENLLLLIVNAAFATLLFIMCYGK